MKTKRQTELDSNNLKSTIHAVCFTCGVLANHYTCLKKYLAPAIEPSFGVMTTHRGTCDFCGKEKDVSSPRDYFYPDFSLIPKSTIEELIKISENKISLFKGEIAFHEKQIRLLQNEKKS